MTSVLLGRLHDGARSRAEFFALSGVWADHGAASRG